MNQPKDFPEDLLSKPTQVEDHIAEDRIKGVGDRIKWSTIVLGLILASILGTVGMGYSFANHLMEESQEFKSGIIKGIEGIDNTLKDIRSDMSDMNTGLKVNNTRLDNHHDRITRLENE